MICSETISRTEREFDNPTYQINTSSTAELEPQENLVITNKLSSDDDRQYISLGQNPDSTSIPVNKPEMASHSGKFPTHHEIVAVQDKATVEGSAV